MANEIRILNSLQAFASIEREWRVFQGSAVCPNVYFTFEWLRALLVGSRDRKLSIAIAMDGPRLVAALPLWQSSHLLPILSPIGAVPRTDPPVLAGQEHALTALVRGVLESEPRRSIVMRNLRADSPVASMSGARLTLQKNAELFTTIVGDFEAFISRQFRRKSRNKVRRYAEQLRRAEATFELVSDPCVMDLAVRLAPFKWQILKGRYNTSQVCSAAGRAFLSELARDGLLRGYSLQLNGSLVAGCLCLVHRGVAWYWIPAYNPDFVRWSPGIALLYLMVEDAHREGLLELNYGYGEQIYKDLWATGSGALVTCEITSSDIRARVVLGLQHELGRGRELVGRIGMLQQLSGHIQWIRTRRERSAVGYGLRRGNKLRSLLVRARTAKLRPGPSVLLALPASRLTPRARLDANLAVVGIGDYRRVVSMRPWEAPATVLEHFRHGDACFVASRRGIDLHVTFVNWNPEATVPAGYASVHATFTAFVRGRWDAHCEALSQIAREAPAHGKLGIVCSFDGSNARLIRLALRAGFERLA